LPGWCSRWQYQRPVGVVVLDVLVDDQPQVPLADDQRPVQTLRAALAFGMV
jgi:hypothetical protein